MLPNHSLSVFKCAFTLDLICGKSSARTPICAEKNQTIDPTKITTKRIGKMMAAISGNLNFLRKRNTGRSMMLMKKAMMTGMMMSFPMTSMATKRTIPSSSMDLLTVRGMSFISVWLN